MARPLHIRAPGRSQGRQAVERVCCFHFCGVVARRGDEAVPVGIAEWRFLRFGSSGKDDLQQGRGVRTMPSKLVGQQVRRGAFYAVLRGCQFWLCPR